MGIVVTLYLVTINNLHLIYNILYLRVLYMGKFRKCNLISFNHRLSIFDLQHLRFKGALYGKIQI